jgi:hypothetical protein
MANSSRIDSINWTSSFGDAKIHVEFRNLGGPTWSWAVWVRLLAHMLSPFDSKPSFIECLPDDLSSDVGETVEVAAAPIRRGLREADSSGRFPLSRLIGVCPTQRADV